MKTSWGVEQMSLPDPWLPWDPYTRIRDTLTLSAFGNGTIFGSNNDSIAVPITLPCDLTVYSLSFVAGNGTGNYDLGLYDNSFKRLASSGSTAMTAAGVKTLSIANMRFRGGDTIYAALALSSSSGSVLRQLANLSQLRGFGVAVMATAVPLPDPYVPATPAIAGCPMFAFGVR